MAACPTISDLGRKAESMTKHEVAKLACRIMALWLFCQAILSLARGVAYFVVSISNNFSRGFGLGDIAASFLITGIDGLGFALLGALLWWKAEGIAGRMISAQPDSSAPAPAASAGLDYKGLMSIAFSAVGVFIALQVIPKLIHPLFVVWGGGGDFTFRHLWSESMWQAGFWANIVELALSIWFIFGSRGIANMIARFRSMGDAKASGDDSP